MRDRTLEDWLDALRVKTAKAKSGIPCPLCGGTDRFHLQRGTRGQAVIGGCRQCSKPLYPDIARAVFGDSEHDSRRPVSRPPSLPRTTKVARPSDLAAAQRAYARRCWESAEWTPDSPSHPTRRWLWNRQGRDAKGPSLWWADLQPPPVVRYLAAFPAPGYPLDGGKPWIPQGPALVTRDCGAASRAGREHLQGSSPPDENPPPPLRSWESLVDVVAGSSPVGGTVVPGAY